MADKLTKKQILKVDITDFQGKKLGFLIAALNVPHDVKSAWLDLLPQMSLPQIERLFNILESKYLDQQTKDADQKLKQELDKIKVECEKLEADLNQSTVQKIKALAKQIN